jgi:hypothetical protein
VRRTGARRTVVFALAALISVTAFLLAGIAGYGTRVGTVGLRDFLRAADATASSLQVQSRLSPDADAQQRAADALFSRLFGGLHVTVYRSVTLPPVPVTASTGKAAPADDSAQPTIRLASFEDLRAHAHLVAGAWPEQSGAPRGGHQPAALQQTAADALGLTVGDTLSVGNTDRITFDVDAIWEPNRPSDPYFDADAAAARSSAALAADRTATGFIQVPRPVLAAKGTSSLVNWTVVPDADHLVPGEMLAMSAAIDALPSAVTADRTMSPQGSVSAGGLADTLRTVTGSITAAQAVSPVPSLLVAAISVLMLIQLARLLAVERRAETALIRSRGASAGQLTRIALGEAALIAVPAAAIGASVAAGVLSFSQAGVPLTGWVQIAVVAAVAIVVITIPAARQARLPANRQQIDDSGRIRALAATSTVLLVLIAAGVALWRFLRTGSALVQADDGTTHIDPIAVLAPALVLIAAAVLAGVLFGVLAAVAEAAAGRVRRLGPALASRQIARRGTVFGVVVVLVSIAIGAAGLAASYSATQSVTQTQTDVLSGGAPLVAQLPVTDPITARPYADMVGAVSAEPTVSAALTVLHRPIELGEVSGSLIGVSARQMSTVVPAAGASFQPDRLASVLTEGRSGGADGTGSTDGSSAGVPLARGTTAVTMSLDVALAWARPGELTAHSDGSVRQAPGGPGPAGISTSVSVTLWIQAPDGALAPVQAGTADHVPVAGTAPGTPTAVQVLAKVPQLRPGSRLVAIDVQVPSADEPMAVHVTVRSAHARVGGGERSLDLSGGRWVAQPQPRATNEMIRQLQRYRLTATRDRVGLSGQIPAGQNNTVRLSVAGPAVLPVALDSALAEALQLSVGDSVTIALDQARQFRARVVAISPLLPGDTSTPTVLADLPGLERMLLRSTPDLPAANELWATPGDAAASAAVQPLVPPTSVISLADTRSTQALVAPTALTLWFGAAGALLLAAIGVASVIASLSLSRRGELVVLRAVGVPARTQARWRRRELLVTAIGGWVLGVAVAAASVLTTVTSLAGSAVVGALRVTPTLHVGWRLGSILIGVHVLLVLLIVAAHGVRLRRQVLRSTPSELVI